MHQIVGVQFALVNSQGSGVMLGDSSIRNSQARTGAAVYGEARSSFTVTNGTVLANNTATSQGGAIHCVNCKEVTAQFGSKVASNQAAQGGACYCDSCELFQMHNCRNSMRNVLVKNNR